MLLFSTALWGPTSFLSTGTSGVFPGIRRPELEADRSAPSNAEIRMLEAVLLHPVRLYVTANLSTRTTLPSPADCQRECIVISYRALFERCAQKERIGYRKIHVYLSVSIFQIESRWTDFDAIRNEGYAVVGHPKVVLSSFLQSVITWRTHEFL